MPKNCRLFWSENEDSKKESIKKLEKVFEIYEPLLEESTFDHFCSEFKVWSKIWVNSSDHLPESALHALIKCCPTSFPNVHRLLNILATLPVSNAEAERQFSKVNKTLTAVRSSMGEDRLEALIMIETYREKLPSVEKFIDAFALCKHRKIKFGLNL